MKIGDFGLATVKSRWSGSGQQYKQVRRSVSQVLLTPEYFAATNGQHIVDGSRSNKNERRQPLHIPVRCLCIWYKFKFIKNNFGENIFLSPGIVLYELLTGTLPYNDVSNKDQV